ncbi:MAG TPA: hypothetical protein VMD92_14725 [Acidobacteriaceae bacterium]|jgi:hypothetical protein|nr:hypothetical protein [Acidobacteriaceae bacterium]
MQHHISFLPLNLTWQNQISRRNGVRTLACGLVFLGICVFAWGLRYKLSLYDPPHSISHRMPAAKLLTGPERPQAPPLDFYRTASSNGPAVLISFTLAFIFLRNARFFLGVFRGAAWLTPVPLTPSCLAGTPYSTRPPPRSR